MVILKPAHFRDRLVAAARLKGDVDVRRGARAGFHAGGKHVEGFFVAQDYPVLGAGALDAVEEGIAGDGARGDDFLVCR